MKKIIILTALSNLCLFGAELNEIYVPIDSSGALYEVIYEEDLEKEKIELLEKIKKEKEEKYTTFSEESKNMPVIKEKNIYSFKLNYTLGVYEKKNVINLKNKILAKTFINLSSEEYLEEKDKNIEFIVFGSRNELKTNTDSSKENIEDYGIILNWAYGLSQNVLVELSGGYSYSEYEKQKSNNIYTKIRLEYNSDLDFIKLGASGGYLRSDYKYNNKNDLYIGYLYGQVNLPLTTNLKFSPYFNSTILSNKVGGKIILNKWNIKAGLDYSYVINDNKNKINNFYTHPQDNSSLKIDLRFKGEKNELSLEYDVINFVVSAGLKFKF